MQRGRAQKAIWTQDYALRASKSLMHMGQYYIHENDIVIEDRSYSGDLYARQPYPDGKLRGTFRTYTTLVDGNNVVFRNCLFENTAGKQKEVGQAIALYLDGDDILLEDCILRGHQDTLFLAPLPLKEVIPGGFIGPKEFAHRKNHRMYFRNCLIEGGIDFIFGGAAAVFENCEFKNIEPGYVFAPSTPKDSDSGFTAKSCRFTAGVNVPDGSCYIARPWRNYGMVSLENCYLGPHIAAEGWHDWGKTEAHSTVRFSETGSYGPGYVPEARPDYVISQATNEQKMNACIHFDVHGSRQT